MTNSSLRTCALALAAVLLAASGASAASRRSAAAASAATAPPRGIVPAAPVVPADAELRLSLAAMERARGNARGVIEQLERIDFASAPSFAGADRAAFLLGQAYSEQGDVARLSRLARDVQAWPHSSVFTDWLAQLAALDGNQANPATSARLVPASPDTATALGRERFGAERIRQAAALLAAGNTAAAERQLELVPPGSRYEARALHMRGLTALAGADAARGEALLLRALASDSSGAARHEARMALATSALERGEWDRARQLYDEASEDWAAQRARLLDVQKSEDFSALWAGWMARPDSSDLLVVEAAPLRARAAAAARAAADLRSASLVPPPAPTSYHPAASSQAIAVSPETAEWDAAALSAAALATARSESARARWAVERESLALADRRLYLGAGLDSLRRLDARLVPGQALLDSLRASLEELQARLRDVRDEEKRRVAHRVALLLEASERQAAWARGMQRLHVAGPDSSRWNHAPAGTPSAASVLAQELTLTREFASLVSSIGAQAPLWLDRSYERAWGPALVDRAVAEAAEARRSRLWARVLDRSLDSSLVASRTSREWTERIAFAARCARTADSLALADAGLRSRIARHTIERTLAALEREREGLDFGRAITRYALAVRLDAADSSLSTARALASNAAGAGQNDEPEDVSPEDLAGALGELRAFLDRHPESPARADVRFRLADLELVQARQEFRSRMAAFLERQSRGGQSGAVPVLEPSRALSLYRRMLAEDGSFPHLDAVRFNAGMILAEAGEPEARRFFAELVVTTPLSPYCQEAWLRMGDMAFEEKRYSDAAPQYAHATTGADPTLGVIAEYKLGWTHFNQDHFEEAADAFRSVLDRYDARRADIHVDIEGEANAYLVHALAGAGGATAFARHFDRVGGRPYEQRVAMALGQQFRRYGELTAAAETDRLVLQRYPRSADALLAAQRQIATWDLADNAGEVARARAELAPRFAPGSAWAAAQPSDSLRRAGEQFARDSWLAIARASHDRAAHGGTREDWARARDAWQTLLAHWPGDAGARALRLDSGKASAQLGDPVAALRDFDAVAHGERDSLAAEAMAQSIVTVDAWYERTRAGRATGDDSLARAVLASGDALLERFPAHALSADVQWRQAQLAVAHHWDDRAAADLARFSRAHAADLRAPLAAVQRGEALFRLERFADAGDAFENALAAARIQHRDSLARRAEAALPVCAYRAAEALVAKDSTAHASHAQAFERVAARWPGHANAPLAQYRAALAYQRAGEPQQAARALETLLERHPRCEYARDARLELATTRERMGERAAAAQAYLVFSREERESESAAAAWLKAADLFAASGDTARADSLRLAYVRQHPADREGAMTIFEALARRDLASVAPGHPVSALLAAPARTKGKPASRSHLAEYLSRAAAAPALGSRDVVAQVRFLLGEESRQAAAAVKLSQPLGRSVAARKVLLDSTLARYRRCADLAVPEWAHASAYRMGETLQDFATALEQSEAPADLAGDDLLAYREVLAEKARPFALRGQDVWVELLRRQSGAAADTWVTRAKEQLATRLAARFRFRPELEYPLLDAGAPAEPRSDSSRAAASTSVLTPTSDSAPRALPHEGSPR